MNYIEIKITFTPIDPWKEIFTSLLAEAGCDSFMDGEKESELLCYMAENLYHEETVYDILNHHSYDVQIQYSISKVETQNWNAIWESNYAPVLIADRCHIRAPFHEPKPFVDFEIVIEPKMSFGTAHHETTSLMIEYLLEEDLVGKKVLDMGAGTGILAILAYKKGAHPITAIDNDEWAYLNNIENNSRNQAEEITVKLGDASMIKNENYDIIIANINRNILLNDIPAYAACLPEKGILLLSGFYQEDDLEAIKQRCAEFNLQYHTHKEKNCWVAARFIMGQQK
ncbi:MAG: 50S ribosomal protein L11 methyltransferase [Bacteroidales bacterium]